MTPPSPLVVFSHLRWDFVFQRPQHILSRLAATRPVLFIEEPVPSSDGVDRWEFTSPTTGVTVCRPHTTVAGGGFSGDQCAVLKPLIRQLVADRAGDEYDLWFYTPMALAVAEELTPRVIIYDKMDDLAAFKFAPPDMREREDAVLAKADVVFTGGPSLYRSTKDRHHHCHCFPSSVDAEHFGRAATPLPEPEGQANIPHPRLGFFGVLDERFDASLLANAASLRPNWHFVLVGPVVKIDPADLPRLPNIHYLGQRRYEDLPAYLSGWDVAILPFAQNEATRSISPTKTLEYMAADKPIVSTPIPDVANTYGTVVGLGTTAEEFVAACEAAYFESANEKASRRSRYRDILAATSWDATVETMAGLIEEASRRKRLTAIHAATLPTLSDDSLEQVPVVVIGAGPTGLSAAYHLGDEAVLLEANDTVGGWCRSLEDKGFTFDWAGHIMFSTDPYVHEMYEILLGDNVHWQNREAWIYSKNVYTRYPFQGSLYGLPADVIRDCVVGAIEARYGSLKTSPAVKPSVNGRANGKPHTNGVNGHVACSANGSPDPKDNVVNDCCADGVAESTVPLATIVRSTKAGGVAPTGTKPENFEEFIYRVWGAGIAKHFAIPYNRKIWAVPLDQMETSWLGGRVPMPDLEEMIEGAVSPKPRPMGPNARFGYPLRGGFQALMNGFLPFVGPRLRLNAKVTTLSPSRKCLTLADGKQYHYERLVSTMPLPALIRAMGDEVPERVKRAASGLRHTSVRCVNLGVGRENLTEKHWIYYPENSVFHRIFVQGNASPHCNPPGGFGLTCEITYGPLKPLPCEGDDLIRRCVEDCIKVGIITADDPILTANQVDMPFAYVVYDHDRPQNVAVIREWLTAHDIHPAGRYGEWEYYNSDHAFLAGKKVAEAVRGEGPVRRNITPLSRPVRAADPSRVLTPVTP
jgi:UDP-galactopyranose mutase